jgi:hypothetical protein
MAYGRGWKAVVRIVGDFGSPILTVGASQKTSVASASIVSHLVTAPPCVIARLATFVARSTCIIPLIACVVLQRRGNRGFLLDAWLGTRPLPQIRGPLRRPQMLPVSHPPPLCCLGGAPGVGGVRHRVVPMVLCRRPT